MIGLSRLLNPPHPDRSKAEVFESGMVPSGGARGRRSAHFYLTAVFFVIFDLEAVFLFGWAIAAREAGWGAYAGIAVFIAVLIAALAYLWRDGALDWGPRGQGRGAAAGRCRSGCCSASIP